MRIEPNNRAPAAMRGGVMPPPELPRCKVCRHVRALEIEAALSQGAKPAHVARKYRIDRYSIARHFKHMKRDAQRQKEAAAAAADAASKETPSTADLEAIEKTKQLHRELEQVLADCTRRRDSRGRLACVKAMSTLVEIETRIRFAPGANNAALPQMQQTYQSIKTKLLSALYDEQRTSYYRQKLAALGYAPQAIDDLLTIFDCVPPKTAPYAPTPELLLPGGAQ